MLNILLSALTAAVSLPSFFFPQTGHMTGVKHDVLEDKLDFASLGAHVRVVALEDLESVPNGVRTN